MTINIGDTLKCAETGKEFVAAHCGQARNYATTRAGEVLSDEGVTIRELRELQDRTRPFVGYISEGGTFLTTWKGARLGDVLELRRIGSPGGHGRTPMYYIRVRDAHGGLWHGRGQGRNMSVTLKAYK